MSASGDPQKPFNEGVITVFAFSPAPGWGLPTSGPFALKLIAWLRLVGIDFVLRHEDDTRKGPKGKNPWIGIDGRLVGDTELIVDLLSERYGVSSERGLSVEQAARGLAIRRLVEEHLHQVFEYEFIVLDAGYEQFRALGKRVLPPLLAPLVSGWLRSHFRRQLTARGIARHAPGDIARMGRADVDAIEALIGPGDWVVADRPTLTDCSVFGLLAPMICSGLETPVCAHARSRASLVRFVERMRERLAPLDPPTTTSPGEGDDDE